MQLFQKFNSLNRGTKLFIIWCIVPLVMITIVTFIVSFVVGTSVAALVQSSLMLVWLVTVVSFIVFFDSRRRWPSTSPINRLANLLTFKSR